MRFYVAVIGFLASIVGCERAAPDRAGRAPLADRASNTQPIIAFYIRDLENQNGHATRPESVWSQNDNMDSITIVISGPPTMVLRDVAIDLVGGPATEGDAVVVDKTRQEVRWRSFKDVVVDSLHDTFGGKQLLRIQPSVLWKTFRDLTGHDFFVDSLHVSVETLAGQKVERGLGIRWD
jgi:hypothetical protein